jgi:hypothetical protein
MDKQSKVAAMVRAVVESLIDKPEACQIETTVNGTEVMFRVRVDLEDVGKVIGKAGRTARSIRTIVAAASQRDKIHYVVDIEEPARQGVRGANEFAAATEA